MFHSKVLLSIGKGRRLCGRAAALRNHICSNRRTHAMESIPNRCILNLHWPGYLEKVW